MKTAVTIAVLLSSFVACIAGNGPTEAEWRAELARVVEQANSLAMPSENQEVQFEYEQLVHYSPLSPLGMVKNDVKMVIGKHYMEYHSEDFEVYQDTSEVIFVMHPKQIVMRSSAKRSDQTKAMLEAFQLVQGSVISESDIEHRVVTSSSGRDYSYVTLRPYKSLGISKQISSLTFIYDMEGNMKEYRVEYTPSQQISTMVIKYGEVRKRQVNINHPPVHTNVMNARGQLNTEYKNYLLVDNRNQPK